MGRRTRINKKKIYPTKYKNHPSREIRKIFYETTDFNSAIDDAIERVQNDSKYKEIRELNLSRPQFILLAQHYGLVTPTLDWSTNPDIALFFALSGDREQTNFSPILYATNPKMLNFSSAIRVENNFFNDVFNVEEKEIEEFICKELKNIDGKNNNENAFICPVAIESRLDFSHRITFQSGKFTIHGPKKTHEGIPYKNIKGLNDKENLEYLNISAEININNKDLISKLDTYLENFGYTEETVNRLGDSKSKLLDGLFSEIQDKYN